jgi:hypothetical protein
VRLVATLVAIDPTGQVVKNIVAHPELAKAIHPDLVSAIAGIRSWKDEQHLILAYHALVLAVKYPVVGYGRGKMVDLQYASVGERSHNNYASIAAGFGFPALVFYILFIGSLGLYLSRVIRRTKVKSQAWRLAQTWMVILLSYAFYLNGAPAEFHFVWLWFGLIAVWVRHQEEAVRLEEGKDLETRDVQALAVIQGI